MNRVILSTTDSIYENLAIEEELLKNLKADEVIIFLWQSEKTIVLGNNQCAYLECNISYCEENQINIARRLSGGGCVYQDLGNLNYSFLYDKGNRLESERQKLEQCFLDGILEALNSYQVKHIEHVNNDLLVGHKKFSGIAYYEEDNKRILHGTLLVDINMEHLAHSLKVNVKKLKFNGVESVRARVVNLKEFNPMIQIPGLKKAITEIFLERFAIEKEEYIEGVKDKNYLVKYKQPFWIFGESPKCSLIFEEKTKKGLFQFVFFVEEEMVEKPKVYSDARIQYDFTDFLRRIEGIKYKEQLLQEAWEEELTKILD